MLSARPADYIDVAEIHVPKTKNFTNAIRSIVARFYDQEFTFKHVYGCAMKDPFTSGRYNLKQSTRMALRHMEKRGEIEVVVPGIPAKQPKVYRNKPTGEAA